MYLDLTLFPRPSRWRVIELTLAENINPFFFFVGGGGGDGGGGGSFSCIFRNFLADFRRLPVAVGSFLPHSDVSCRCRKFLAAFGSFQPLLDFSRRFRKFPPAFGISLPFLEIPSQFQLYFLSLSGSFPPPSEFSTARGAGAPEI